VNKRSLAKQLDIYYNKQCIIGEKESPKTSPYFDYGREAKKFRG